MVEFRNIDDHQPIYVPKKCIICKLFFISIYVLFYEYYKYKFGHYLWNKRFRKRMEV